LSLGLALAVAGCERDEELTGEAETLTLALDWVVNPDHVGIYTALANGYFGDAGLEVDPKVPSDPSAPIKQVAAGRVDLAVSYEPEVLLARDQGLDVIAVAAIAQEPLTSLISLDAKVTDAGALEDKRLATAGIPYQDAYLEAMLRAENVPADSVRKVDVGFNLEPALLAGKVDAVLGMFRNIEGVDLIQRDKKPTIVPVDRLGIPTYDELVLVANASAVEEDPEAIRLFLGALERGTRVATDDPKAATKALLDASDDLDPELTRAQVDATLPVLLPAADRPYGFMEPDQWREFAGFFADMGVTQRRLGPDKLLTNELLPGEIE
jgi:putative hydroxymethylpyrimidine transport system substrate-binding protein